MDMLQNKRLLEEDQKRDLYLEEDQGYNSTWHWKEWQKLKLHFECDKLIFPRNFSYLKDDKRIFPRNFSSLKDDNLMFSKCDFTICAPVKYCLFNANVEILKYNLDNVEFKFEEIQITEEVRCKNITQLDWLLNYDYMTKISTYDRVYYMLYDAKFKMNWNNLINILKFDTCPRIMLKASF